MQLSPVYVRLLLMNLLRLAVPPGLIAGLLSILTGWFWMGTVFHRYQRATPDTWRAEGARHYLLASIVRVLSAVAIAVLYAVVAWFRLPFFGDGFVGALRFAAVVWIAIAAPVAIEAAIYIRLNSMVVVGQVIDWLTTIALACGITAAWMF
jgi:hypothetical protein